MGGGVFVLVGVDEGVRVMVGDTVGLGVMVGIAVGGSPDTTNWPTTFHSMPTKICTVYVPGSHSEGGGAHSEYPRPPVVPSQGKVS